MMMIIFKNIMMTPGLVQYEIQVC